MPVNRRANEMSVLKSVVHRAGQWYIQRICLSEFQHQTFRVHNERSIEYRFALQALAEHHPKNVLDIGTGTTAFPHLLRSCGYVVTAIDNIRDYWPEGMMNRHWTILNRDILDPRNNLTKTFDAITCISVIVSLLATGGILVLTTPYSHHHPYPNVYTHPEALYGKDAPYICRSSSETELNEWLAVGLALQRRELWRMFTGTVWATGQRCEWEMIPVEDEPHQLGCFVFRRG
jgi:hypothetical protein